MDPKMRQFPGHRRRPAWNCGDQGQLARNLSSLYHHKHNPAMRDSDNDFGGGGS